MGYSRYIKTIFKLLLILSSLVFYSISSGAESFYSIQTGRFPDSDLTPAGKQFNLLYRKLGKQSNDFLRIQEEDGYYVVRVGRFETVTTATKTLKRVRAFISWATITKEEDFSNAVVIILHTNNKNKRTDNSTAVQSRDNNTESKIYKSFSEKIKAEKGDYQSQNNEEPETLLNEIANCFSSQEYEKASTVIKKGLSKWPDNPVFHAWYGAVLLDSGLPEKAYEEYRKAAELQPNVPEFHSGAGYSLMDIYIDKAKQSIDAFQKALSIDPWNVSALEGLGIIYVSTGRKHLASDIYEKLKQVDTEAAVRLGEFIKWGMDWGGH